MTESIQAGGLEFQMEHRTVGEDGGPSMFVSGTVDGQQVEVLRFDMFYKVPHYHYGPRVKNMRYELDPLTHEDPIGWVISQLQSKLPKMVAKAGYEPLGQAIDQGAVIRSLPEIEQRWRAVLPVS